jgi:hypothetical protein
MNTPDHDQPIEEGRPMPTYADLLAEISQLRAKLLRQTNVVGAGAAVLNAIHRAGGYHVFDPGHQGFVQRSIQALENAVTEAINP